MNHPVEDLILKDGGLFRKAGSTPYMNTPEISVVGKGGSTPDERRQGLVWIYSFTLNAPTDFAWDNLFRKNFALLAQVAPEFKGTDMLLTCEPANLKSRYGAVKAAIIKANADYKTERANLITRVADEQRAREAEARRKDEAGQKIRAEFDNLEL